MISTSRMTLLALLAMLINGFGCEQHTDTPASAPAASAPSQHEVRVAAAADLKFALDEVIAAFHIINPRIKVTATYGSSGNFYTQLTNKAPFDLYFSADIDYPRRLAEAGLTIPDSQFMYAIGQIVIWVRHDSPLDVQALGIEALAHPSVKKIAIANPEHAPYGRAAEAAMKSLGVGGGGGGMYERIKHKLVLGENIAQTAQFIESGAADIGIIALSLAMAPAMKDKGTYWTVPLDAYPALEQGGVILAWARDLDATQRFKAFVTSERDGEGRAILKRYGFVLPGE